ncbi:MAG: hypothetical protein AAF674_17590 [Pseudomonadota bacterium]
MRSAEHRQGWWHCIAWLWAVVALVTLQVFAVSVPSAAASTSDDYSDLRQAFAGETIVICIDGKMVVLNGEDGTPVAEITCPACTLADDDGVLPGPARVCGAWHAADVPHGLASPLSVPAVTQTAPYQSRAPPV